MADAGPATVTLIDEIFLLEILQDEDRNSVRRILMEWQRYLQMSGSR